MTLDFRPEKFSETSCLYHENVSSGVFFLLSVKGSAHTTRLSGDFNLWTGKLDRDSAEAGLCAGHIEERREREGVKLDRRKQHH